MPDQQSFIRHLSRAAFQNLRASRGTIGARVVSALRALLQRSPTLTCEIHPRDTLHLYDGVSKVADIDCSRLPADGTAGQVQVRLNPNYILTNKPAAWTSDMRTELTSRIKRFERAGYEDVEPRHLADHVEGLLLLARAHPKSRSPEGLIEALFVNQARRLPDEYYPLDRQFAFPGLAGVPVEDDLDGGDGDSKSSRIDVVAVSRDHRLLFLELKLQGDARSWKEFKSQLLRYRRIVTNERRYQDIVSSYRQAYEQRTALFGEVEGIDRFPVDWDRVAATEPEVRLVVIGYGQHDHEHLREIDTEVPVHVYALNQTERLT